MGLGPRLEAEWIHRELGHVIGQIPPFDLKALIAHFGLSLDVYPLRSEISGLLLHFDRKYHIVVNQRHNRVRRCWTAAHELYHYLAHRWRLAPLSGRNGGGPETEEMELEANAFAAELLMPEAWVKSNWSRIWNVGQCAELFGVSITAMRLRLEELRILRRGR